MFHDGQLEGRKVQVSMHLRRRRKEEININIQKFYHHLLKNILSREELKLGSWFLLNCKKAWVTTFFSLE